MAGEKDDVTFHQAIPALGDLKSQAKSAKQTCPLAAARAQFREIGCHYKKLASTGCTTQFCQAGRMIHTDEARVGEDRALEVVQEEAFDFLRQLQEYGLYEDDASFERRVVDVKGEIQQNAIDGKVRVVSSPEEPPRYEGGRVGGNWSPTREELELGFRIAWKHARRCIMRSEYQSLRLCDLRHIKTSREMCESLLEEAQRAFNGGDIIPTVFAFPPRQPGKLGPRIWNQQLLAFAGYDQKDGSVLGDPMNVELTKEIIKLGWQPPRLKTRWDLLPLVSMAEDDEPYILEMPETFFPLVRIRHPHYPQIERLGLRWVPAPALSGLGFDIGGLQYTAAPFIGWFMDSEIGVRDLADTFRYNSLPKVVKILGWLNAGADINEIPEAERLLLLSRAQVELNFAAHWSFNQDGVRMVDTLTASTQFSTFDDRHFEKKGYRLPADPYWLAPPQGSIIPLWHRGGSPNYQPKPMIVRNLRDPVKAWKLRKSHDGGMNGSILIPHGSVEAPLNSLSKRAGRRIRVFYCTTGATALKLANKTHQMAKTLEPEGIYVDEDDQPKCLDAFDPSVIEEQDIVLIVASSCGRGDVPPNGENITSALSKAVERKLLGSYAIFGNGDRTYQQSFNGAAEKISRSLCSVAAQFIIEGFYPGDTAKENPPWSQLDDWLQLVKKAVLQGERVSSRRSERAIPLIKPKELLHKFSTEARVIRCNAGDGSLMTVTLKTKKQNWPLMGHLSLLVPNERSVVNEVLNILHIEPNERMACDNDLTFFDFLTLFIDLSRSFVSFEWASDLGLSRSECEGLKTSPVPIALRQLPDKAIRRIDKCKVCLSMPLSTPRTYSIASSSEFLAQANRNHTLVQLVVKKYSKGKFSDDFLFSERKKTGFRCYLTSAEPTTLQMLSSPSIPIVAFATGSGIAPVCALLQHRVFLRNKGANGLPPLLDGQDSPSLETAPFSLFIGCRQEDVKIMSSYFAKATQLNLVDLLSLTPSNPSKQRAQEQMFERGTEAKIVQKIRQGALVLACGNMKAVREFRMNLDAIVGCNVREALGERYIEEAYSPAG